MELVRGRTLKANTDTVPAASIISCSLVVVTPGSGPGDERSNRSERANDGESSSGRTRAFGTRYPGSNPGTPAKEDESNRV